jgi:hypothetical protein
MGRNFIVYNRIKRTVAFKGIALPEEFKKNNRLKEYLVFDSHGEFKLYKKLLIIFPESLQFKIFVHYLIDYALLKWRCDFFVKACNNQATKLLQEFCSQLTVPLKVHKDSGIFVEYKGIQDKNFYGKLKVISSYYPSLYDSLLVVTENKNLQYITIKDTVSKTYKQKEVIKTWHLEKKN